MTTRGGAGLYTPQVLALALRLAEFPLREWHIARGEARSRICGSRVIAGMRMAPDGTIGDIGAQVTACAIGQAAAAIFLGHSRGRRQEDIEASLAAVEAWLGGGDLPEWPELESIAGARPFAARHAAILLPWKAALAALSNQNPHG